MAIRNKKKERVSLNIRSTIATFKVEGISPSMQAIRYCKLRDAGRVSCKEEIETLKQKYITMAKNND
ncbi:MAG: hypothetical protein ACOX4P_08795 [Anaerovoracaceae bacterium]